MNATKDFLDQIVNDLRVKNNFKALSKLLYAPSMFGVVIDNSGRMADELQGVKNAVHKTLESALRMGNVFLLADSYLLQTFNQVPKGRAPLFEFRQDRWGHSTPFLKAVDELTTATNMNCSTVPNAALIRALNFSQPNGTLDLFSNGSSSIKDKALAPSVAILAAARNATINRFLTGNCASNYFDHHWQDQIGGHTFVLSSNMFHLASEFLASGLTGTTELVSSHSGSLTTNGFAEFPILIDSSVSRVTFVVSGDDTNTISFFNPSGTNVTQGQPGVTNIDMGLGRAITVMNPEFGGWKIRFTGSQHFAESVIAATPISLRQFRFVERGGNPDHPVDASISGQPVSVANTAMAYLTGGHTDVTFKLVTPGGELIQDLTMTEEATNAPGHFVGAVVLPTQPFKVVVTGLDTNGVAFQRAYPTVFQVQPVEVRSLQENAPGLHPGVPYHLRYLVSNFGDSGVFNVTITGGDGTITNVSPVSLALGTGETNIIEADILMPEDMELGASEFITVAVSRDDDPTIYNGTVERAFVEAPLAYARTVMSFKPAGYWPLNETAVPPSSQYVATNLGLAGAAGDGCYMTWWQPGGTGFTNFFLTNSIQHTGGAIGDGDNAAVFGKSGQYVVFQRHNNNGFLNDAITFFPPFSIEVWAYASNTTAGVRGIVSEGRAATQGGTNNNYANVAAGVFLGQSGANYIFDLYYTNGLTAHVPELHVPVAANTWQHLVATFDGTNANFYNNGSLVQTADYSAEINAAGEVFVPDLISPLLVGCGPNLNSGLFRGNLDEVAVYASALPAEEVLAHYAAGTDIAPATPYRDLILNTNPVIYIRLDEPDWGSNGTTLNSLSLPVATNYGTAGAIANGVYQPNTAPGVRGPIYPGFGSASYGVAINGFNAAVDIGAGNLTNTVFDPQGTNAQFTVMTWFKPNPADAQARLQSLMGRSDSSWRLNYDNNGLNRFNPGAGPELQFASNLHGATNGFQFNDGQWHFVAGVFDGTNDYLYLDGRLALTNATAVGSIIGSTRDIILGGSPSYTTPGARYFDGVIAQAAFFTNALTAANIQQVYDAAVKVPVTASTNVRITTAAWLATTPASLALRGTGGIPYGTFYVLTSANLATPLGNWLTAGTNFFDGSGNFSVTNLIQPGEAARFFLLKGP